jgi:repressor of nif and glnA expression
MMNSTNDIVNIITHQSNSNIDNLAQSFFILLIFCSCLSDFIILKNGGLSEKVNNISDAIYGVVFNKCNKDEKGNIVINKNDIDKKEIEDFLKDSDDESETTTIDVPIVVVVEQEAHKRVKNEKDEKDKKERRHKKKKSKENKVE